MITDKWRIIKCILTHWKYRFDRLLSERSTTFISSYDKPGDLGPIPNRFPVGMLIKACWKQDANGPHRSSEKQHICRDYISTLIKREKRHGHLFENEQVLMFKVESPSTKDALCLV